MTGGGAAPTVERTMAQTIRCACGVTLSGETGEQLLAAAERHVSEEHLDETWRSGPGLDDLRRQVVGLGRRVETLERALAETTWPN